MTPETMTAENVWGFVFVGAAVALVIAIVIAWLDP